jgi:hypothetical protein
MQVNNNNGNANGQA